MTNYRKPKPTGGLLVAAAGFILSGILISGCGLMPKSESDPNAAGQETQAENFEAKKKDDDPGQCANPYYPIKPETKREYKVTGDAPSSYILNQKIESADAFTEKRVYEGGLTVTSKWSCTDDGLRNADYNNTITKSQMKFEMETLESEGITLPKRWEKGGKWETNYKIRTRIGSRTVNGTVVLENELVSLDENVRVKAGNFSAARIDSVIKINLDMSRMKIPTTTVKMSNWFAPDVGLVKQEAETGFGKTGTELISKK